MDTKKILIVSGEPSGDLHASNLVKDLKALKPGLEFFGLGGGLSRGTGVDVVFDISKLALVGMTEVLKNIFVVGHAYKTVLRAIDDRKPDLAILVDYPGFNLRLAKELKKRSIPVVYYISPQVWAWGRDRVEIIKKCVKKIVVFFKFEEELYKTYGIDAEFVGHPLMDTVRVTSPKDETIKAYDLSKGKPIIALLPGSRMIEVKKLLPVMIEAAKIIDEKMNGVQFVVARHPALPVELYQSITGPSGLDIRIAAGDTYNILNVSAIAIVASGTATLETSVIGTPFVLIYKASLLTYIIYNFVVKIRFLGLANIIADREIVPELLQYDATPKNTADTVLRILASPQKTAAMRDDLAMVKASLGSPGARARAAAAILPLLQ